MLLLKVEPGIGPLWGELESSCPDDPEKGGWLIPLHQHLLEAGAFGLLAAWLLRRSFRAFARQLDDMRMVVPPLPRRWWARLLDAVMFLSLAASLCLVVFHKYQGHKMAFLLQPCHVLHASLLALFFAPRGSGTGAILFSTYLHLLFAPFLGFVAADLSCYTQWMELQNWAFQHFMLLAVPCVWIATARFPLYTGRSFFLVAYSAILLFHWLVLTPVGLVTAANLNYMLCPPVTVPPLLWMGRWYRPPTMLACALLAWLLRYVFLEAYVRLIGAGAQAAPGAGKARTGLAVPYADIELDERQIVTNSREEAAIIRQASEGRMPVEVQQLREERPISSIDRLPSIDQLVHSLDDDASDATLRSRRSSSRKKVQPVDEPAMSSSSNKKKGAKARGCCRS